VTIGFFHVDTSDKEACATARLCASGMVRSARRAMKYTPIVQFTDMTTKPIKGVDAVRRKPAEPMGLLRIRHYAGVDGEWVFVDTDVLFQQPVKRVFRSEFDIAVTKRDWSHLKAARGFSERMPFNTGVVFSRCPHFWSEVYTRMRVLEPEQQEWMGEQQTINDVAADTHRYHVRRLPGSVFNYPPELPGPKPNSQELMAQASIVHYKGPLRKPMMLEHIKNGVRQCA
jgi:hypothetical protein